MNDNTKGVIYAFLAVLCFGTFGVTSKLLTKNIDGLSLTIWMILISTIVLFCYLLYHKKHTLIIPELKKHFWFFVIMGFLGIFLHQITYLKSYELLNVTEVITLFYVYPIFMIILSRIIHKEKISTLSTILIIIGFLGLYIAMTKGSLMNFNLNLLSLLVLFTSFLWALFSVLLKNNKSDSDVSMFLFNFIGLIFLLMLIPFINFDYTFSRIELIGLFYLSIFTTSFALVLWGRALIYTKISVCSNIALLTPVIALTLSAIILKEKLNLFQLLGFGIILLSTFINLNLSRKKTD